MITSVTDFQTVYNVKDGEIASSTVLSRPSNRLKVELNEISSAVNILLGDTSSVQGWEAGIYESGVFTKYNGVIYKSLIPNNTTVPGTNTLHWEDCSALSEAFSNISSGGTIAPEIIEANTSVDFPVTGEIAKIYIAKDTNTIYRWSGIEYVALTAGGSAGGSGSIVMGVESFTATNNQTQFTVVGSLENGPMVYIEGVLANPNSYNVSAISKTVTFNEPMPLGTNVQIGSTTASVIAAEGYIPATRYDYIATSGQTTFSAVYEVGNVDVFRNGLKLSTGDFAATSGTSVVLNLGATVNDVIEIISYSGFDVGTLTGYVPTTGATMTGALTSFREKYIALASDTIDLSLGNLFSRTIAGVTTFVLQNVPAAGQVYTMTFEVTNGGAFTVNWFSGIKWGAGVAPSLTVSGMDVLSFYTKDGGTTWVGLVLAKDVK